MIPILSSFLNAPDMFSEVDVFLSYSSLGWEITLSGAPCLARTSLILIAVI